MPEINDKYAGGGPRRRVTREDLPYLVESWDRSGNRGELLAATTNLLIGHAALEGAAKVRPGVELTLRNGAHIHRRRGPARDLGQAQRLDQIEPAVLGGLDPQHRRVAAGLPDEARDVLRRAIGMAYEAGVRDARDRILDAYDEALADHEPLLVLAAQVGALLEVPAPVVDDSGEAHEPVEEEEPAS